MVVGKFVSVIMNTWKDRANELVLQFEIEHGRRSWENQDDSARFVVQCGYLVFPNLYIHTSSKETEDEDEKRAC